MLTFSRKSASPATPKTWPSSSLSRILESASVKIISEPISKSLTECITCMPFKSFELYLSFREFSSSSSCNLFSANSACNLAFSFSVSTSFSFFLLLLTQSAAETNSPSSLASPSVFPLIFVFKRRFSRDFSKASFKIAASFTFCSLSLFKRKFSTASFSLSPLSKFKGRIPKSARILFVSSTEHEISPSLSVTVAFKDTLSDFTSDDAFDLIDFSLSLSSRDSSFLFSRS
mmetsp:Transcript_20069/g.19363  ORF Transcript_20069/g.19363 Transcript_20069/m.19363 type:complete len:231 (-) Transcript_20069:494-1186(-)